MRNYGRGFLAAGLAALAMAAPSMKPVAISKDQGIAPAQQIASKKSKRAARRLSYGGPDPYSGRSKNPPNKRQLKRNMVTHSRRLRRKHRRAA